jgi:aurora kinase, other
MLLHLFLQKHLDILKLKKNNINILSIEDDKPTNLLLYKMFSTLQCNITCYFNGYDSLLYLNNNIDKINIIILDYILPDINCIQMLYMINEIILQKKCLNPPIIILSSSNILSNISINEIYKNYHFIKKPIHIKKANNIIDIYINNIPASINFIKSINPIDCLNTTKHIKIGEGGFSECYKCLHDNIFKVIKIISYNMKDKRNNLCVNKIDIIKNINNEIIIMKQLKHPFIINVYKNIIGYNSTIILMEYALLGDLFDKIHNGLTNEQIKSILLQLSEALQYIHSKNIIHRDIKPENILIGNDGNIRLSDFGFSCFNKGKTLCGTIDYIAPEIINQEEYKYSVDYWSLGILLYEMYHKYTPFNNTTLIEYNINTIKYINDFTTTIKNLFLQLIVINPKERLQHFDSNLLNIKNNNYLKFHKIKSNIFNI